MCKKGFAASVGTSMRDWKEVIRNLSRIVPRHSYLKSFWLNLTPTRSPPNPFTSGGWSAGRTHRCLLHCGRGGQWLSGPSLRARAGALRECCGEQPRADRMLTRSWGEGPVACPLRCGPAVRFLNGTSDCMPSRPSPRPRHCLTGVCLCADRPSVVRGLLPHEEPHLDLSIPQRSWTEGWPPSLERAGLSLLGT